MLTSDEEGPASWCDQSRRRIKRKRKIDWCLVGEPTANKS